MHIYTHYCQSNKRARYNVEWPAPWFTVQMPPEVPQ